MAAFSGVIAETIKLGIFSHKLDEEIGKIIIDDLIVESEDDEFLTENYEKEGKLDTEKLIQDFLAKHYIESPKEQYGQGIDQEILCVSIAIAGPVEGEKGNRIASVSRPPNLEVTFSESDFQKPPISYAPVVFLNDMLAIGENIFLPEYKSNFTRIDQKGKIQEKGRKGLLLVEGGLGAALWFFFDADNEEEKIDSLSSEYGHTIFSSRTEEENIIAKVLKKYRPNKDGIDQAISKEYALSGPGFVRIYENLKI